MAKSEQASAVPSEAFMNEMNELKNSLTQVNEELNGYKVENGKLKKAADILVSHVESLTKSNALLSDEKAGLENELTETKLEIVSLKKEIEILLKGDGAAATEKKNGIGDTFEVDGEEYKILVGAVSIPGIGKRSALEILADEDAQKKLVAIQSGVIQKVSQ